MSASPYTHLLLKMAAIDRSDSLAIEAHDNTAKRLAIVLDIKVHLGGLAQRPLALWWTRLTLLVMMGPLAASAEAAKTKTRQAMSAANSEKTERRAMLRCMNNDGG